MKHQTSWQAAQGISVNSTQMVIFLACLTNWVLLPNTPFQVINDNEQDLQESTGLSCDRT